MEYISAEEFLKQPKEVQEVFRDWWEPSEGDLYASGYYIKDDYETIHYGVRCIEYDMYEPMKEDAENNEDWTIKEYVFHYASDIPLLTEGQLRKFIEDKTKGIVKVIQWNPCVDDNRYGYTIYILAKNEYKVLRHFEYKKLGTDLLQAYWKVACEIAKEC